MRISSRSVLLCLSVLLAANAYAACDEPELSQLPDVVVGKNPLGAALADFDKDGKLDLATPRNADGTGVWVQRGNGDGTFQTGIAYPAGTTNALRIIAADMDNDTWLDLVTANYWSDNISILLNNGDGTFGTPRVTPTVSYPARVVAGDADHDGYLDIGVIGISFAQIHLGKGDGTFDGTISVTVDGFPQDLAFGDFDGNGTTDFAAYGQQPNYDPPPAPQLPSTIKVHSRAPNGTYSLSTITETGTSSAGVIISKDLNGDGKSDLIAASARGVVTVHLRSGSSFTLTDHSIGDNTGNEVGLADLNEDGKDDIVVATGNSISFPILLGNGDGTFGQAHHTNVVASQYYLQLQGFGLGDVNGDFRTDVVLVDSSKEKAFIFENNCTPRFSATTLSSSVNPSAYNQAYTLTATIAVAGTIDPTGTVSFFWGDALIGTVSVTPATRSASFIITTASVGQHTYSATYNGDSEFAESSDTHIHTVNAPVFGAPPSFLATGNPNGEVFLNWTATQDTVRYEVLRQTGGTWNVIGSTTGTELLLTPGSGSWFYAVRAVNAAETRSASSVDLASTVAFAYPSLGAGSTIHGADVTDLRSIIDALRGSAGLGTYSFTDPSLTGGVMKAVHVSELRIALSQAMTQAGMNPPAFSRSITTGLVILANDVLEMRTKIR